jgi:hypothetical protein
VLVACEQPHQEKVMGMTHLDSAVSAEEADGTADAQCRRDAPVEVSYPGDTGIRSHGISSQGLWQNGYYLVVCTAESTYENVPLEGNP